MDREQETQIAPINQYFKDSNVPDVFDELSTQVNPSSIMDSVAGELSASDNSLLPPDTNEGMLPTMPESSELSFKNSEVKSVTETGKNEDTQQPVICRIFSSNGNGSSDEERTDNNFFDLIGSSAQPRVPLPECSLNRETFCIYPGVGMNAGEDGVSDELFINGRTPQIFTGKGLSAKMDRHRDAWIPSTRTRQALIAAAAAPSGTYVPDKDLLTKPGVVLQEDIVDNVYQIVNHYLGESEAANRKVLTVNDVTQDERGLRDLIQAECYRAAVNLTSRLLTMYGQGVGRAGFPSKHTVHSVQLWFTRLALLVKLGLWSVAWEEAEPWWDLDRIDLYFQFYSELYGGRPGTIVPFSFRLLLAELPQYVHKFEEAYNRLFSVLSTVRKIIQNLESGLGEDGSHIELMESDRSESLKLWRSREVRVLHSVVNIAFQQKDYRLTVDVMKTLINHSHYKESIQEKRILVSSLGRVYLQLGDVFVAKQYFEQSRNLKNQSSDNEEDVQELIDSGLLAVSENDFQKGFEYFIKASEKDPTNIMVVNNAAVCLLYEGKHREAIKILENTIETKPTSSLYESVLLNLCTLYELESSRSTENKYKMLRIISKYKGDSISLSCLKLQ